MDEMLWAVGLVSSLQVVVQVLAIHLHPEDHHHQMTQKMQRLYHLVIEVYFKHFLTKFNNSYNTYLTSLLGKITFMYKIPFTMYIHG